MESTPTVTQDSTPSPANYDTPWKIALEQHFQTFMAFYFPQAHEQIDWSVKHEFLDTELQSISKDALVGTRHVDKLVKVQRLSGEENWLCIHVEVQMARVPEFAKRMFVYNYRIFDRYDHAVVSMAVLGDDDPNWLPDQFGYTAMGCDVGIRFPIAKLAYYAKDEAELASNPNPFALLTLAYLKNRATATDMLARFDVKCQLVRLLHAHDWDAALIRQFFLVIDWMMALPPELANKLTNFVIKLEEGQKMEYVSSVERILEERMIKKTAMQTNIHRLSQLLGRRFGSLPTDMQERINNASADEIDIWFDRAIDCATLDEVFLDHAH